MRTALALISAALLSGCGGGATPAPVASHPAGPGAAITRVALADAPPTAPPPGAKVLRAVPLAGPHESEAAACSAFGQLMEGRFGWQGTTCTRLPFSLREGGPFAGAEVLVVANASPSEPLLRGKGASFFAVRAGESWFATGEPLETVNSGAGHTFTPKVTPVRADIVAGRGRPARVLFRMSDVVDSICNVCEPPLRGKLTHVRTRLIVTVCAASARGAPACTPPLELHPDATVTLSASDVLTFDQPILADDGENLAAHGTYAIVF